MSISLIRPYFSAQVSLSGFDEWTDGFGEDNTPATILDRSFHQRLINVDGRGINQETIEYVVTNRVKLYFKGFGDPAAGIDNAILDSQAVIVKCLNIADYTATGLKGVFFDSMTIEPYDEAGNDNIVVATITFSIRVFNCLI